MTRTETCTGAGVTPGEVAELRARARLDGVAARILESSRKEIP